MTERRGRILLAMVAALLLLAAGRTAAIASGTGPMVQMKATVDEILAILGDDALAAPDKWEEKKHRIMEVVDHRFDFRIMSQLALARNWRDISPAQQDRFVELFAELLESTYIDRVKDYTGDEEVVFKDQEIRDGKAVVNTVLVRNNTETPVIYKMRSNSDEWLVYDVIIEGVSLVRNYRTQFNSIIEKEKYEGLIKRLEEKIAEQRRKEKQASQEKQDQQAEQGQ